MTPRSCSRNAAKCWAGGADERYVVGIGSRVTPSTDLGGIKFFPLHHQPISFALEESTACESTFFNEILQITRGRGARCACDDEVMLWA
jgi:hypothetical protein